MRAIRLDPPSFDLAQRHPPATGCDRRDLAASAQPGDCWASCFRSLRVVAEWVIPRIASRSKPKRLSKSATLRKQQGLSGGRAPQNLVRATAMSQSGPVKLAATPMPPKCSASFNPWLCSSRHHLWSTPVLPKLETGLLWLANRTRLLTQSVLVK